MRENKSKDEIYVEIRDIDLLVLVSIQNSSLDIF